MNIILDAFACDPDALGAALLAAQIERLRALPAGAPIRIVRYRRLALPTEDAR